MVGLGRRFCRDRRGGVAVTFALALVPLIGAAGAAADYWQAANMRSELQKSADAAALVAAQGSEPFADRERAALAILNGSVHTPAGTPVVPTIVPVMRDGREVAVSVTLASEQPTSFLRVLGIQSIDVAASAEASAGRNELFDIAFVLDTTGSMRDDRIAALKATTTDLIDQFEERRGSDDQIRISIIPFAEYVNVGTANRNASWIQVPADVQAPRELRCRTEQEVLGEVCTRVWRDPRPAQARTCTDDGRRYDCSRAAEPGRWINRCEKQRGPNRVEICSMQGGGWTRWQGCVGSRNAPYDTRDSDYGTRIPGVMGVSCSAAITPATDDFDEVKSRIRSLGTGGETYISTGLMWGWRALSVQEPLAARASTATAPVRRFMILVTDGQNTRSARYPLHNGNDGAAANARLRDACTNMAADTASGITLYTIAFAVGADDGGTDLKTLLAECSSMNGGDFFDAADATALASAMEEIGGRISVLRLTQ